MIALGCVGRICLNINPMCLKNLKPFMYGLQMKHNCKLVPFILITEENTPQMNFNPILDNMGLGIKQLLHTILNITVL